MLGFLLTIFRYLFLFFLYLFLFKLVWLMFKSWPMREIVPVKNKNSDLLPEAELAEAEIPERESVLIVVKTSEPNLKLGEIFVLGQELTIGRSKGNTIQILDPFVSGTQARIFQEEEQFCLEDLNSANGTLLNSYKIKGSMEVLANGDIIEIGGISFKFVRWAYEMDSNH